MTRVATQPLQQLLLSRMMNETGEISRLQTQVATGKKAQTYSGLENSAQLHVSLKNTQGLIGQYIENADMVDRRLSVTHGSVAKVIDVATYVRQQVMVARDGSSAGSVNIGQIARDAVTQVTDLLNVTLAGAYLFGGTITNSKPVDTSSVSNLSPDSNGQPRYFSGSKELSTARLDDSSTMGYGLTAADPAFVNMFESLRLVIENPSDHTRLGQALDGLTAAIKDLSTAEASIGSQMRLVADMKDRHAEAQLTLNISIKDVEDVDVGTAMVELTEHQTTLQASYMMISQLKDMNLMSFLR